MTETIRNQRAANLPAHLSRSWLLVNAASPETFRPAQASEADSVIFDMEAAVPQSKKDAARDNVVDALNNGMSGWVRINSITTEEWQTDLEALSGLPGLRGIVLPNTEKPEQVTLTAMGAGAGVPVLALIETAIGVENATHIAEAPGTFRLALGTNDLRKNTGIEDDPLALAYVRSRLVISSRVGGLPGAIDGPTPRGTSTEDVREACRWTMKMGMTGTLVLDLDALGTINTALAPSEDDRAWARELLAAEDDDSAYVDGSYLPRLKRARKIAQLADSYGLWKQ